MSSLSICSQNDILLDKLLNFYYKNDYLQKMLSIINGTSTISLRIVDWFSTNYSKKNFTMFATPNTTRFKVYEDYKLKLKAYSKKRFDPFCRWERIQIPIERNSEYCFETTIGQMNFFKWALENKIIDYIEEHYEEIEVDMNENNSLSKTRKAMKTSSYTEDKHRKKREELSINAVKTFRQENVEIIVRFNWIKHNPLFRYNGKPNEPIGSAQGHNVFCGIWRTSRYCIAPL